MIGYAFTHLISRMPYLVTVCYWYRDGCNVTLTVVTDRATCRSIRQLWTVLFTDEG